MKSWVWKTSCNFSSKAHGMVDWLEKVFYLHTKTPKATLRNRLYSTLIHWSFVCSAWQCGEYKWTSKWSKAILYLEHSIMGFRCCCYIADQNDDWIKILKEGQVYMSAACGSCISHLEQQAKCSHACILTCLFDDHLVWFPVYLLTYLQTLSLYNCTWPNYSIVHLPTYMPTHSI